MTNYSTVGVELEKEVKMERVKEEKDHSDDDDFDDRPDFGDDDDYDEREFHHPSSIF